MAIYLYYGKIGDGKTYHVLVNELLPALRKGRKVYTNMDGLNIRRVSQFIGQEVNLVQWSKVEEVRLAMQIASDDREGSSLGIDRGALVIVDEAQMVWDARCWKDCGPGTLRLFEYHRHFGLDIVLVTQSPGRLDKAICRLSNEALHVKNLRFLGSLMGRRYVINVRQTPWDREVMSTMSGKYDPRYFGLYRSAVLNVRARVSKGAVSMVWLLVPLGLAFVSYIWVRNGGMGITKGQSGKVVTNEAVGVASTSVQSPVIARSAAALHAVQDVEGERLGDVAELASELRKQKAIVVGSRDLDGVLDFYLKLRDGRVIAVSESDLDEYEIVGKL